ncbi:leucine-rich repeat-containing protein 61-like [Pseudonaja textilis]|uniref:leucine-rich repeat-containing protein 61-like n=1 Tax=Pseudonaja textilis TaxID=8673 RepID=UPI000EA8E224|nr:leucine-rich repeat-containing protein 61-like [Pseudonaja textilis]
MDFWSKKSDDPDHNGKITIQLLKSQMGEFNLESILLLKLRGVGILELGCLDKCTSLEWLDLSVNGLTHLGPLTVLKALTMLKALTVLNVAANRISNLEPLSGCESLQSLNTSSNQLHNPQQLQCLAGLQHLDNVHFHNGPARLSNPFCAAPSYPAILAEMFQWVKVIDDERVSRRGSELYQLCKDLDHWLQHCNNGGCLSKMTGRAQPWVEECYWEVQPARRSSIVEEAYKQFSEALLECRELSKQADHSICQAEQELGHPNANLYVF